MTGKTEAASKTSRAGDASLPASSDGVAALDRAIAILNAFTPQERALTLAEIAARTGLYKSTILRLAGSLIRGHLLERLPDGLYRIGSGAFRLGAIYQRSVAVLPLSSGSGGRILAAFSGEAGEPYETIRRSFHYVSLGDRDPDTAGLSAPVFGPAAALVGAITLAGPRTRISEAFIAEMKRPLLAAAARATRAFGGEASGLERAASQT